MKKANADFGKRPIVSGWVLVAVWTSAASAARAQDISVSAPMAASGNSYGGSAATKATRSPILPKHRLEVGGELAFLTADRNPDSAPLRFSDVALMPLHVRGTPSDWLELSGGTSLLIKQSEEMHEPVWQGSDLALRVPFSSIFASNVHVTLGPLMKKQGQYWQTESSLLARLEALEELRFELRGGYTVTGLHYSRSSVPHAWLHELMTHGEIQFGGKEGGAWIGVDYYIPIASGPDRGTLSRRPLDPNVRLNLSFGAVVSPRRTNWDLYVAYVIVDRGDVAHPESTLPIVSGGFDQRLWILGVQHHFDLDKKDRDRRGWE